MKKHYKPDECDLSISIGPMFYETVLRKQKFDILFRSKCLLGKSIQF